MKKLLCIIAAVCLLGMSCAAVSAASEPQAELLDAVTFDGFSNFTVNGRAEVPDGTLVTVFVLPLGDTFETADIQELIDNGADIETLTQNLAFIRDCIVSSQRFEIKISLNQPGGYYAAYAKAQGTEAVSVLPFAHLSPEKNAQTLAALNSAADFTQAVTEYAVDLTSLNLAVNRYLDLSQSAQEKAEAYILSQKGAGFSAETVADVFHAGIFMGEFETAATASALMSAVQNNYDIVRFDTSEGSRLVRGDVDFAAVYQTLFEKRTGLKSVAEVGQALNEEAVVYIFNHAAWGKIMGNQYNPSELTRNQDMLPGLNLSQYNSLSAANQTNVCRDLAGRTHSSCAGIVSAFNELVSKYANAKDKNNSGGGTNGGGRNGGGGSYVPSGGEVQIEVPPGEQKQQPDEPFSDIAAAEWARTEIVSLAKRGIISGDGDGRFRPEDPVLREEFVKMLVLAFGIEAEGKTSEFADVQPEAWYASYVAAAWEAGLVNGISETEFGSGQTITREDMATIIDRVLGSQDADSDEVGVTFMDEDQISGYAADGVRRLSAMGILNGDESGAFRPREQATRAETAKMLYDTVTREGQQ